MPNPRWIHDRKLSKEYLGIVGVDEAGRGCLAGPVLAGAVIIPTAFFRETRNRKATAEINDSKQFDEPKREDLYRLVMELAEEKKIFTGIGRASVEEIEKQNIVGATCMAMKRAMYDASESSVKLWKPNEKSTHTLFQPRLENKNRWAVLVDGKPMKKLPYEHSGLVKGDTKSLAIAMASMLAKVTRDRYMRKLHKKFPEFGFDSNKGYGAQVHLKALHNHGPTEHHRPRFLRNILPTHHTESANSDEVEQSQLSLF